MDLVLHCLFLLDVFDIERMVESLELVKCKAKIVVWWELPLAGGPSGILPLVQM